MLGLDPIMLMPTQNHLPHCQSRPDVLQIRLRGIHQKVRQHHEHHQTQHSLRRVHNCSRKPLWELLLEPVSGLGLELGYTSPKEPYGTIAEALGQASELAPCCIASLAHLHTSCLALAQAPDDTAVLAPDGKIQRVFAPASGLAHCGILGHCGTAYDIRSLNTPPCNYIFPRSL